MEDSSECPLELLQDSRGVSAEAHMFLGQSLLETWTLLWRTIMGRPLVQHQAAVTVRDWMLSSVTQKVNGNGSSLLALLLFLLHACDLCWQGQLFDHTRCIAWAQLTFSLQKIGGCYEQISHDFAIRVGKCSQSCVSTSACILLSRRWSCWQMRLLFNGCSRLL